MARPPRPGDRLVRFVCKNCGAASEAYRCCSQDDPTCCSRRCSLAAIAATRARSPEDRFWEKVDKNGPIVRSDLGPCWVWTGARNNQGYGDFMLDGRRRPGRRSKLAHRCAWLFEHGEFPDPCALHLCDNPLCVRVSHLFVGSIADNNRDTRQKGRSYPKPVLNEALVARLRELSANGVGMSELSREFSINRATIAGAVSRRTWRHV
jgi:hypothetical protein